jgi:hypothetical protein
MAEMQFTVYSTEALSESVRDTFHMPGNPFGNQDAEAYLKANNIVFYRDERSVYGIVVSPDDGNGMHILDRAGWLAYRSQGVLSLDSHTISTWPDGHNHEARRSREAWVAKHGHDKAWMVWNEEVTIARMSETEIQVR